MHCNANLKEKKRQLLSVTGIMAYDQLMKDLVKINLKKISLGTLSIF